MGFFSDMSEESFDDKDAALKGASSDTDFEDECEDYDQEDEYAPEPEGLMETGHSDVDRFDMEEEREELDTDTEVSDKDMEPGYSAEEPAEKKEKKQESASFKPEYTVVDGAAKINGSISSEKGVVVCEGAVVTGGVCAREIVLKGGEVQAGIEGYIIEVQCGRVASDITAKETISVYEDAIVVGNISSGNAEIYGKVKGNISSTGVVTLFSTAVVKGDIRAKDVIFEDGSKFQGSFTKTGEIDDSEFE